VRAASEDAGIGDRRAREWCDERGARSHSPIGTRDHTPAEQYRPPFVSRRSGCVGSDGRCSKSCCGRNQHVERRTDLPRSRAQPAEESRASWTDNPL